MDARRWPIREEHLLTIIKCESFQSLEGDRGRDAMMTPFNIISRRFRPEIVLSRKCLFGL